MCNSFDGLNKKIKSELTNKTFSCRIYCILRSNRFSDTMLALWNVAWVDCIKLKVSKHNLWMLTFLPQSTTYSTKLQLHLIKITLKDCWKECHSQMSLLLTNFVSNLYFFGFESVHKWAQDRRRRGHQGGISFEYTLFHGILTIAGNYA